MLTAEEATTRPKQWVPLQLGHLAAVMGHRRERIVGADDVTPHEDLLTAFATRQKTALLAVKEAIGNGWNLQTTTHLLRGVTQWKVVKQACDQAGGGDDSAGGGATTSLIDKFEAAQGDVVDSEGVEESKGGGEVDAPVEGDNHAFAGLPSPMRAVIKATKAEERQE